MTEPVGRRIDSSTQPSPMAPGGDGDPRSDDVPPGWTNNPSSWRQRIPIVVLAVAGGAAATWLALYQQAIVDTVWEPFFGTGTTDIVRDAGFSGFVSLAMIGPGVDEVLASLQHLRRERARGESTWRVFWGIST